MDIPYTVQARPDTGLYNAKVGIWLFLASEVMLFGALFSAYILLRVAAPPGTWPHGWLNVPLGTVNTLILALSAVTTLMAWAACKARLFDRFKLFQAITLLLALIFVSIKGYEYRDKFLHYEIVLKDGRIADGHLVERPSRTRWCCTAATWRATPNSWTGGTPAPMRRSGSRRAQIQRMQNYGPAHNTFTGHLLHPDRPARLARDRRHAGVRFPVGSGQRACGRLTPSASPTASRSAGLFWHFVDLVWIFLFPVLYLT